MSYFICETCGTEYPERPRPPDACAVCVDERQYVGWSGQRWLTHAELAEKHGNRLERDGGLLGVGITPAFAIDQRALIIPCDQGNLMWEAVSLVTNQAVTAIQECGVVTAIALSHPHFYSSMVRWSEALGGVPIYVHSADRAWVRRTSPQVRFWEGERLQLSSTMTLIHCAGHFPGSTVLHWREGVRGGGALFPGDALQVVFDRRHVSFMYSYPNLIPLRPDAVRRIERTLRDLDYEDVYGFTWGRNIMGGGKAAVAASFERYLMAVRDEQRSA
jgi:hypothetical protein